MLFESISLVQLTRIVNDLEVALKTISATEAEHSKAQRVVEDELTQAWKSFAEVLFPSIHNKELLHRGCRIVDSYRMTPESILQQYDTEKSTLALTMSDAQKNIQSLRVEEKLIEIELKKNELQTNAQVLKKSLDEYRALHEFENLLGTGFDTKDDEVPWWNPKSLPRQRAADKILASPKAAGAKKFREIAARYHEENRAWSTLQSSLHQLGVEERRLRGWQVTLQQTQERLKNLDSIILEATRTQAIQHMQAHSDEYLRLRTGEYPQLVPHYQRISGLVAKRRYIDAVFERFVKATGVQINSAILDLKAAIAELNGPTVAHNRPIPSSEDAEVKLRTLQQLLRQQIQGYGEMMGRLLGFASYSLRKGAEAWWPMMSNNADGSYIDEVVWQQTHRSVHTQNQSILAARR